jgi:hypothetical protein
MESPMKTNNRNSVKGMAKTHKSAGSESIKSEEKIGSSDGDGIRFGYFKDHPDKSRVNSPESK